MFLLDYFFHHIQVIVLVDGLNDEEPAPSHQIPLFFKSDYDND
jgi:hypothetical protein